MTTLPRDAAAVETRGPTPLEKALSRVGAEPVRIEVEGVVSRAFTAEVDSKAKITEPEPLISSLNTKTFAALEMGLLRRRVAIYKVCCAAAVS
jgi:hypothetical protein